MNTDEQIKRLQKGHSIEVGNRVITRAKVVNSMLTNSIEMATVINLLLEGDKAKAEMLNERLFNVTAEDLLEQLQ